MFGALEGTGYEIIQPEFSGCIIGTAHVERLWTGGRWCEGPAWFGGGRYLVFSDIPNDRMLRDDDTDGAVPVFRSPARNSNGNTNDGHGRLVSCEHLARRVIRTEHDGRRLNSPNDLVVRSDGSVWFTDPDYGIIMDYEGKRSPSEIGSCNVYRWDPDSGEMTIVAEDYVKPNGLAFSPDERPPLYR